jgi:hypothetical protein
MAAKNSLTAADAARVEAAFHSKVSTLQQDDNEEAAAPHAAQSGMHGDTAGPDVPATHAVATRATDPVNGVDKSALAFPEPRRVRDKDHLRFVASQPCLICGRRPADAHHLRFAQGRALGRKVSDEFTVPLCRIHHHAVHRSGDEAAWWRQNRIDPTKMALKLWRQTRITEAPRPGDRRARPIRQSDQARADEPTNVAAVQPPPTANDAADAGRLSTDTGAQACRLLPLLPT